MPLYEYECDACGQRFEVIQQRFSDPAPEACAKCGKGPVHRQLSSPAIQFKGTGWYVTDYAQKGKSLAAGTSSEKSEKSDTGEKSDKTENKSDKSEKSDKTETKKTSDTGSTSSTTPTTSTKE